MTIRYNTIDEFGNQSGTISERKRLAMAELTPRNEKNLNKRLNMNDFTGGDELDKIIKEQRKLKNKMKGKG